MLRIVLGTIALLSVASQASAARVYWCTINGHWWRKFSSYNACAEQCEAIAISRFNSTGFCQGYDR